jgi:hypothetical protein
MSVHWTMGLLTGRTSEHALTSSTQEASLREMPLATY